MGRFKPLEKILTNVVDTLGNKIGALPSTSKSIADYSDIINQGVRLDTADAYKNLFHVDTEFAKGYGGELKSGSLKYGSDDMPPSLTDKELIDAQNEIKGLTQDYLKDLPDDLTVYRYGDLDNETGVSSFTLNPNYNVDSSLPWQKRLQSPMQTFKVKKEDVLASPDINAFFGGGRGFDEQEVIIGNDKVGALPSSNELYRFEKPKYRFSESKAIETSKLFKSVNKFPALSKSEETLVASSSAPVNEIAGLGRVKIEKIDPNDMAGSKKRFDELKALTSGYKQDRAKATIIRLENGENAIQYMQPPTEVKKLNISDLIATQDNVVLGTNKTADDVMPLVVKKDGKFFIRDGHHRIAQNINSGDKTADVRLIDLDKGGFLGVKSTKPGDIAKVVPPTDKSDGIFAFHGSGQDFDEFKLSKIGTGEGNQAFGYGLYFTDSKDIAKFYKSQVTFQDQQRGRLSLEYKGEKFIDLGDTAQAENAPTEYRVLTKLKEDMASYLPANPKLAIPQESKNRLLKRLDAEIDKYSKAGQEDSSLGTIELNDGSKLEDLITKSLQNEKDALLKINPDDIKIVSGKTYEVNINAVMDDLVDYDKPLSLQKEILDKIEKTHGDPEIIATQLGLDFKKASGGDFLTALEGLGASNKKNASQWLTKSGIKGIRYLDNSARNTFGGEILSIDKTSDGFKGKVVLDDPNRQTGLGGSGRTITTSKTYKTEKEAKEWADKAIGKATNNYVIFDDKIIDIMAKYGIVGAIGVSAMQRGSGGTVGGIGALSGIEEGT
jgi:hypothetical protein